MDNIQGYLILSNVATIIAIWIASVKIVASFTKVKVETTRNTKDIEKLFDLSKG